MGINFSVEPFDVEIFSDWNTNKEHLIITFFDTEIFSIELQDYYGNYLSDDTKYEIREVAKQELGSLLSERLAARIVADDRGGVTIKEKNDGA